MLGATSIITSKLVLLLIYTPYISRASPSSKDRRSNPLGIDWDPAPSPEDGPPLSAHASRDKALLPAQISAIVGAYLFSVCCVGIILLLLNRRVRRQLQYSVKALDIELVRPTIQGFSPEQSQAGTHCDPSPVSPGQLGSPRNFSWPSSVRKEPAPYVFPSAVKYPPLPANGNPFVDDQVVQADREMLNRDLEDIYAHVMEQEEAKAKGIVLKDPPTPLRSPAEPPSPQRQNTLQKKSSQIWGRRSDKAKPANLNLDESASTKTHSRSSSILSALRSPKRKGPKQMQISSPMPTPLSATFPESASDEEPLSPRYYAPPPPPPVPKDQVPYMHARNDSGGQVPVSPTRSIAEQLSAYPQAQRQPQHQVNASQPSIRSSQASRDPASATSTTSQTPLFPPPKQKQPPPQPLASNAFQGRSLPFRQFEAAPTSPSFASQSTKTTILERTNPLSPGLQSGLKTPWSAGAVPYSPYQPFTPIMPMTPRLVTKQERKAKEKAEKKKPVLELIKSEDELWDSGY